MQTGRLQHAWRAEEKLGFCIYCPARYLCKRARHSVSCFGSCTLCMLLATMREHMQASTLLGRKQGQRFDYMTNVENTTGQISGYDTLQSACKTFHPHGKVLLSEMKPNVC